MLRYYPMAKGHKPSNKSDWLRVLKSTSAEGHNISWYRLLGCHGDKIEADKQLVSKCKIQTESSGFVSDGFLLDL